MNCQICSTPMNWSCGKMVCCNPACSVNTPTTTSNSTTMMNTQHVVDENNQLRKVADELATWLEITNPDSRYKPIMPDDVAVNAALDSYNALPHVKAKGHNITYEQTR